MSEAFELAALETSLLTWSAVHCNLCLALRQPSNASGPGREIVEDFVVQIGALLVDRGFYSREELVELQQTRPWKLGVLKGW